MVRANALLAERLLHLAQVGGDAAVDLRKRRLQVVGAAPDLFGVEFWRAGDTWLRTLNRGGAGARAQRRALTQLTRSETLVVVSNCLTDVAADSSACSLRSTALWLFAHFVRFAERVSPATTRTDASLLRVRGARGVPLTLLRGALARRRCCSGHAADIVLCADMPRRFVLCFGGASCTIALAQSKSKR